MLLRQTNERRMTMEREYKNVQLKGDAIGRFKEYCRDMHLKCETSDAGDGYVHFEVLVNEKELEEANNFLMSL